MKNVTTMINGLKYTKDTFLLNKGTGREASLDELTHEEYINYTAVAAAYDYLTSPIPFDEIATNKDLIPCWTQSVYQPQRAWPDLISKKYDPSLYGKSWRAFRIEPTEEMLNLPWTPLN